MSPRAHAVALMVLAGALVTGAATADLIAARAGGPVNVWVVLDPTAQGAAAEVLAGMTGRLVGTRLGGAILELRFDQPAGDPMQRRRGVLLAIRAGRFTPLLPGCAG